MSSADHSHSDLIHAYLSGDASEEQSARLENLMREDPRFRELFEAAEAKLNQDFETLEPVETPAGLLDEIERQIDQSSAPRAIRPNTQAHPGPWRTIGVISSLAAAVAIGFHLFPAASPDALNRQINAVAFLEGERGSGAVIALYDDRTQQILARVSGVALEDNQVRELWLVRADTETPISLGLLPNDSVGRAVTVSVEHQIQPGQDTLAISVEPAGGSTQDGPSGPVVLAGKVEAI